MPLNIAIIGLGSAGPAAAMMLSDQGHEITLFERAESNQAVGAGFMLQPSGMSVLEELGILPNLLEKVDKITSLYCKTLQGSTLLDLHYQELAPHLFGAGTYRADLLNLFVQEIEKRPIQLLWNHEIVALQQDPKTDQIRLADQRGKQHGAYDLVLICDGSRSKNRALSGLPYRMRTYPWGALWFIGQRDSSFSADTLWQCVNGTHELAGFLPTGQNPDKLSLFWSIRLDQVERWKSSSIFDWKAQVLRLAPQAETFLDQIEDHSQLSVATYYDVTMKQWHGNRIAILGDAAHALSPQLGQGVNLALMDAATISHCIAQQPIDAALRTYSQLRKKHLDFYQFSTRAITPFFQSDHALLGKLRDLAFPLAGKSDWVSRQMTASMAGLKTGPFASMPIPPLSSIS